MQHYRRRIHLLAAAFLVGTGLWAAPALAQLKSSADAVCGRPLGVGRLTVNLPREMLPEPLGAEGLRLDETKGRALYPAVHAPGAGAVVQEILREGSPLLKKRPLARGIGGLVGSLLEQSPSVTIYFLFRGDTPLELTLRGRSAHRFMVTPRADPAVYAALLAAWWRQYTAPPGLLETKPDYPPLVGNYLSATLARRLNLKLPPGKQVPPWLQQLDQELGLTLGTESIRVAIEQQRILGLRSPDQPADQPLPEPISPPAPEVSPPAADVQVEPVALRVPEECFYLHFASFDNFVWFQDTLARWGGDLQNLLATRGLDHGISQQIEEQLVLKLTDLSRLLGPTVIAEVAILGTDTFFREGASFGVLFHARNNAMLAADITGGRLARLAGGAVKEEKITIGSRTVSLLSSPDGRVRSYYVADGDYHFVTTSRTLVQRFLETASGTGALGRLKAFRHARAIMPLARQDTVFVYLSEAFFRNFTSPRYRVEMVRRLEAGADIDLVRLARLAAAAEGKPAETIEQLIAGELLPPDFGPRGDGSRTVLEGGQVYDSLRGHSGAFLPIPETPVRRVTPAEASAYRKFADFYRRKWGGRMDPTIIAIKRHALPRNRERVVLDARLSPFAQEHFELLSRWAGPPSRQRLAPVKGDLVAGEVALRDQYLFGGLQDSRPPLQIVGTSAVPVGRPRDLLVGYLGTSGAMGLLGFLDAQILRRPDDQGYSSNLLGLHRWQIGDFTVFSLHPEVLAAVTPQLRFQQAERPAQLRLHVGDPSEARMAAFLNDLGYVRTRETSLGNLRLMSSLSQQFHVPPKDSKTVAEELLGAKLICPLGGKYFFQETPEGGGWWTSTALEGSPGGSVLSGQAPAGYQAPPLSWFRGLELEATMTEQILSAHAEVVMQLPAKK
jgi:hypothetical protein